MLAPRRQDNVTVKCDPLNPGDEFHAPPACHVVASIKTSSRALGKPVALQGKAFADTTMYRQM